MDARCVYDGFKIFDQLLKRELHPRAIGEPRPAKIIADQRVPSGQRRDPRLPDKTVPIELEVMDKVGEPDERGSSAAYRIGDARAVAAGTEANLLS